MRALGRVQAVIGNHQPLDRPSSNNVGFENLVDIRFGDVPIPDGFRINNDVRSMLALVKAAGLIGPDLPFEPAFRKLLLE